MSLQRRLRDLEQRTTAIMPARFGPAFLEAFRNDQVLTRSGERVPFGDWLAGFPAATREALAPILEETE